ARRQLARIHRDQNQTESAVNRAADAEDQGVLYGGLDLVVDRDCYSLFRLAADRIKTSTVNAAAATLTYIETKKAAGLNTKDTTWRPAGTLIARIVQFARKICTGTPSIDACQPG